MCWGVSLESDRISIKVIKTLENVRAQKNKNTNIYQLQFTVKALYGTDSQRGYIKPLGSTQRATFLSYPHALLSRRIVGGQQIFIFLKGVQCLNKVENPCSTA